MGGAIDDVGTRLDRGSGGPPWASEHAVELIVVIVMSFTAVLTAWSGYQTAKWSGVVTENYSRAAALNAEATRVSSTVDRHRQVDVSLTLAWVEALAADDQRLADFLHERFPERLRSAADAWRTATERGEHEFSTPLDMPQYAVPAEAEVSRLLTAADEATADARTASERVDRYVVMGVVFAVVLLLGALSAKLDSASNRTALLVLALVGLAVAIVVLVALPVEV